MTMNDYSNEDDDGSLFDDIFKDTNNDTWWYRVSHILTFLAICLILWLFLAICWHCCSYSNDESEDVSEEVMAKCEPVKPAREIVVAKEVRPGLIMVQGYPTREETYRIVQEYEALRGMPPSSAYGTTYNSTAPCDATTLINCTYAHANNQGASSSGVVIEEGLIDFEGECRPPPYAPRR